jgi:hypothetical protein
MNFAIDDIEAAITGWRHRASSEAVFVSSAEACALARLYGAMIVNGTVTIDDADLDDAQRDALRILSMPEAGNTSATH